MPKSRTRKRAKKKQKVYTHYRSKKKETPKKEVELRFDQLKGVIDHSKECIKLKILRNRLKQEIALCARSRDNMSHMIDDYKQHREWLKNRIEEHSKACVIKMKLFLGSDAKKYKIPENFHLGSTDLQNGYVTLQNEEQNLVAILLDEKALTHIIPHNEKHLKDLNLPNLLKSEDVTSAILSSVVSKLENTIPISQICVSANCLERKPKINFESI